MNLGELVWDYDRMRGIEDDIADIEYIVWKPVWSLTHDSIWRKVAGPIRNPVADFIFRTVGFCVEF